MERVTGIGGIFFRAADPQHCPAGTPSTSGSTRSPPATAARSGNRRPAPRSSRPSRPTPTTSVVPSSSGPSTSASVTSTRWSSSSVAPGSRSRCTPRSTRTAGSPSSSTLRAPHPALGARRARQRLMELVSTVSAWQALSIVSDPAERIAAWTDEYEAAFPSVFDAYYSAWGDPSRRDAAALEAPGIVDRVLAAEVRATELLACRARPPCTRAAGRRRPARRAPRGRSFLQRLGGRPRRTPYPLPGAGVPGVSPVRRPPGGPRARPRRPGAAVPCGPRPAPTPPPWRRSSKAPRPRPVGSSARGSPTAPTSGWTRTTRPGWSSAGPTPDTSPPRWSSAWTPRTTPRWWLPCCATAPMASSRRGRRTGSATRSGARASSAEGHDLRDLLAIGPSRGEGARPRLGRRATSTTEGYAAW